jgi:hypothetical protein
MMSWTRPTRKMEATEAGAGVSSAPDLKGPHCFLFPKAKSSDRNYAYCSLQEILVEIILISSRDYPQRIREHLDVYILFAGQYFYTRAIISGPKLPSMVEST